MTLYKYKGESWDESQIMDSIVDGICQDKDCGEVSSSHEPDAEANWCPHCEKNTVKSIPILLGII